MDSIGEGFGFSCGCLLFIVMLVLLIVFGVPTGCAGLYLLGS